MGIDEYLAKLDGAFDHQRRLALAFIEGHNAQFSTELCPFCGVEGHVPGLPCPECKHKSDPPFVWGILRSSEWGWVVVGIGGRVVLARFEIESP